MALFLFPELRVLVLSALLEHFQHYSGQIRRDEEDDKNFWILGERVPGAAGMRAPAVPRVLGELGEARAALSRG